MEKIGVVNLHFPWDSVLKREKCIATIVTKLKDKKSDYLFVMVDFNCGDNSDVIRMLLGECDVFGTKIYSEIGMAASDHYGVYAKIESVDKEEE